MPLLPPDTKTVGLGDRLSTTEHHHSSIAEHPNSSLERIPFWVKRAPGRTIVFGRLTMTRRYSDGPVEGKGLAGWAIQIS